MILASEFPLKNVSVVLTRAQEQQSAAKDLFAKHGAKVIDLPSLVIGPPNDWAPLDQALKEWKTFDWIIFSSSNGINSVESRLHFVQQTLASRPKNLKIAAVGRKTANHLIKLGVAPDFVPPQFHADSLIQNFPEFVPGIKMLIPRVQTGGRPILAKFFIEKGVEVVEIPAYESYCPNSIPNQTILALTNNQVDVIAFTSGKTVVNTVQLLNKYFADNWQSILSNIKIISIGPQTSKKCKEILGRVNKEAESHDIEGLVQACIDLIA